MLIIHSLCQAVYGLLKKVSKQAYRSCAVIVSGTVIVSLISLNNKDFGGSGKNKLGKTHRESNTMETDDEDEDELEEVRASWASNVSALPVLSLPVTSPEELKRLENLHFIDDLIDQAENRILTENPYDQELNGIEKVNLNVQTMETQVTRIDTQVTQPKTLQANRDAVLQEVSVTSQPEQQQTVVSENNVSTYCASNEEYDILCRIVEAEAGGEDTQGKILVANVIMNRVNSKKFPNSIKEVVFQKKQFSPITDGRYASVTVSYGSREAVNRALAGEDYSQGALYFSARSKADPSNMSWFDRNLTWLFTYGNHEFYTN